MDRQRDWIWNNMKVVFVLIFISCSGHTNADCVLSTTYYDTLDKCEAARIIPEYKGLFGTTPAHIDKHKICLATVTQ